MNKKSIIETRHPVYSRMLNEWNFYLLSYKGGIEYIEANNLFSHRLEHKSSKTNDYLERKRRSYYLNYCKPIVDLYTSYLFKEPVEIQPIERFSHLLVDADRKGTGLSELIKQVATLSSIFGHIWVGVDMPKDGGRPYLVLVYPQNFLNWETDDNGNLTWCLVREPFGKNEIALDNGKVLFIDNKSWIYKLWTKDEWFVLDSKGDVLESASHGYGCVPFVCVKHREIQGEMYGESLISDIAYVNRELYNLCSLLQEILARQTFSQLIAQGSVEEYGDVAKLGTSSIFLYPEGKNPPQYISPATSQAELLIEAIDRMIMEIYRIANLKRGSITEPTEQSGISKAFDFLDTQQALSDKAFQIEQGMRRVLQLYERVWMKREPSDVTVKLTRNFGVQGVGELIKEAKELFSLGIPDSFKREIMGELANLKLGWSLPESKKRVMEDIKKMEFKDQDP